jgi:hypothetical protein
MRLPRLEFILTKDQLWLTIGDGLELRVKKEDSTEKVIPAVQHLTQLFPPTVLAATSKAEQLFFREFMVIQKEPDY